MMNPFGAGSLILQMVAVVDGLVSLQPVDVDAAAALVVIQARVILTYVV